MVRSHGAVLWWGAVVGCGWWGAVLVFGLVFGFVVWEKALGDIAVNIKTTIFAFSNFVVIKESDE